MPEDLVGSVIEAPDEPTEATVEAKETPAEEPKETQPVEQPAPKEEQAPVTEEEPIVEVDGQRLTATQIKEALDSAKNKAEWQKSNTQKSQEIAEERRRIESERQELLLGREVAARLKTRPDLANVLFAPEAVRDPNAEYQALLGQRPQDIYSQEYQRWEMQKDQLVRDIAKTEALRESEAKVSKYMAEQSNRETETEAVKKYVESSKVSQDEFRQMVNWVGENFQAKNGMFPKNCLDVAYRVLYSDREVTNAKLETSKAVVRAIEKAKPAKESAAISKEPDKELDESDGYQAEEFVKELRFRSKRSRT